MSEKKPLIKRKGPYRIGDVAAERYDVREWLDTSPLCWSYEAFDQEDERAVRVRVIRQTILPRTRDHNSFLERIEPLLGLELPGVATHYRVERDEGKTLVISELIDGLPLRTLIDNRRQENRAFSAIETLAVLSSVSDALGVAGDASVHGDLQPTHIKLLSETLVLESLGLAAALPPEETIRALRDTPDGAGYLAPEVLDGKMGDGRSDVYSLAMIAGELLTGRIPPAGDVGMEEFLSHVPPLADDVIRRGITADLDGREASPSGLVSALAAVLGAETWRTRNPFVDPEPSTVPTDPEAPVKPAEDGTIPFARPMLDVFKPSPPKPNRADADVDEAEITQKNQAADVARAVAALEEEERAASVTTEEHARDPRAAVTPSADGTQQITADMIEPNTTVEDLKRPHPLERDPAAPVAASPDGTQQITADMLQPFDDSLQTTELHESGSGQASLGLDPKLVRAAKKLDKARDDDDDDDVEVIDEEDVQTVVERAGPRSLRPPNPASAPSPTTGRFPSEENLRTERVAPPHMPENMVAKNHVDADVPTLEQGSIDAVDMNSAGVDSAHRFMQSKRKSEESEDLPAVMLDESLKNISGPAKPRGEVTHRVKRPTALRHDQPRPPQPEPKPSRSPALLRWTVIAAVLGVSALLLCLIAFWLMR